jgi:hypothetical protein
MASGTLSERYHSFRLRVTGVEVNPGWDPVIVDPALQVAVPTGEVAMHLLLTQAVVVEIVKAGVRQLRV